ncbi:MAG: hypothetical protein ACP6IP_04070 [Candidatus Njordarchaeia archaeon]
MEQREEKKLAKEFLNVIKYIEKYEYYMIRRSIGLLYLIIAATVSLFVISISYIIELIPTSLLPIAISILVILMITTIILASVNVFKIPKIYEEQKKEKCKGSTSGLIWFILSIIAIAIIISANFIDYPDYTMPLTVQMLVGLGNLGNFYDSWKQKDYPGKIEKEYLIFSIVLLISAIFILVYPGFGWFVVTVTSLLGAYILGLYITLTAEKALE